MRLYVEHTCILLFWMATALFRMVLSRERSFRWLRSACTSSFPRPCKYRAEAHIHALFRLEVKPCNGNSNGSRHHGDGTEPVQMET